MIRRLSTRFSLRLLFLFVAIIAFLLFLWPRKQTATCTVTLATAFGGSELEFLQSKFVIIQAFQRKDVQQLDVLRHLSNPVEWIQSHLSVAWSKDAKSETAQLTITARNADPEELKIIVEAIGAAYEREVALRDNRNGTLRGK